MLKLLEVKKSYISIPILGILFAIIISVFSYKNRLNIYILRSCDFTGMTTMYLKFITITNIIILLFDLCIVVRGKQKGFPYIFNKIFSIIFFLLAIISIISFIFIRKNEEKISIQFENELVETTENILPIKSINKNKLNELQEYNLDKFHDVKLNIANEVKKIKPDIRRYIEIVIPISYKYSYVYERAYYSIAIKFVIFDLSLSYVFFYHIKDELIEKNSRYE